MVDRPAITALRESLEQAVANNACLRAERDKLMRMTEVTIADDKKQERKIARQSMTIHDLRKTAAPCPAGVSRAAVSPELGQGPGLHSGGFACISAAPWQLIPDMRRGSKPSAVGSTPSKQK